MKQCIKKYIPSGVLISYYYIVEFLVALLYDFPGQKLNVIGVTGTKGKSTTVYLITRILEEAGFKVASSSSIEFRLNKKSQPNVLKMGLPSRGILQLFFKKALQANVDYMVLECTSEGLAQCRVDFVHFIAAVFTNLAPEHIESHGSYERYKKAKRRLFELLDSKGVAVINGDDAQHDYIAQAIKGRKVFYSLGDRTIQTPLIGEFNQYNALAAWTVCKELGVEEDMIKKTLLEINRIPGRLDEIKEGQPFRVFVDYAHNPSSLEAVLKALWELKHKDSTLITLTGSPGGGRDKWKRPAMGKIAARYSDIVIFTTDDPHQEDPSVIIDQMYQGAMKEKKGVSEMLKILDRKEAIAQALRLAQKNDIVLLAGMGIEPSLATAKGEIPWNEKEIVIQELKAQSEKRKATT